MKYLIFIGVLLLFRSPAGMGLEIDKILLGRILETSDSKKTILINRGKEDGLELKDHAKLSLPKGLVARAVISRLSPNRSVWSLYRFYDKEKIMPQVVVTIKISSPIKLTSDESKGLGLLSKKEENLPISPEEKKHIKKMVSDIKTQEQTALQYDKIDYSALDDPGHPRPLDPEIDWSGLDGKKDLVGVDPHLDFSNLY